MRPESDRLNLKLRSVYTSDLASTKTQGIATPSVFRISATYEMRTTEYGEICISIDTHTVAERAYKGNRKVGKESKVAKRHRERLCVQVLIKTDDSINQHPQTA
jgi:hypothetical protein